MESDGQPCEGRCTKNSQCARGEFYAVKSVEVQRLDGLVDFMRRFGVGNTLVWRPFCVQKFGQ
jgi:hypothetical protein